jgi:hypothetical protein
VITTALTIAALASVLVVYAVTLGTYTGGAVTVGGVASGAVTYSSSADGSGGWSSTLQPSGAWYAKLAVGSGYTGPVTITWQLQSDATGTYQNVGSPTVTTITLSGSAQDIYATANGGITGNRDWSSDATSGGTYHIIATVVSA